MAVSREIRLTLYLRAQIYELYAGGKVSFAAPSGSLTFENDSTALAEVRELVEAGPAGDPCR